MNCGLVGQQVVGQCYVAFAKSYDVNPFGLNRPEPNGPDSIPTDEPLEAECITYAVAW